MPLILSDIDHDENYDYKTIDLFDDTMLNGQRLSGSVG
jgi:hypothetical protein